MVVTTSKLFLQRWEALTPLCFLISNWPFIASDKAPRQESGETPRAFFSMHGAVQHSYTEIQWAEEIWGVAHKASATNIKRIWVIFDIMEWIRLASLQRREGVHRQNLRTQSKDKQ